MPLEEVLIFTRYPRAGKVKTRLFEKLGHGESARLHRNLTERVMQQARQVSQLRQTGLSVWFTGGTVQEMRDWLGSDIKLSKQEGNGLGERMAGAFRSTWTKGVQTAVLIGSDCPGIDTALIAEALDLLHNYDLVLGPASDGGYYLIGLHRDVKNENAALLFENIAWGTSAALHQTLERAKKTGLSIATLKELHDIDRPEDLVHLRHYPDLQ